MKKTHNLEVWTCQSILTRLTAYGNLKVKLFKISPNDGWFHRKIYSFFLLFFLCLIVTCLQSANVFTTGQPILTWELIYVIWTLVTTFKLFKIVFDFYTNKYTSQLHVY